jgi:hypothetical protein
MLAGNEPGSSTGNLASSNCRYFMPDGQGEITGRHPVFFLAGGPWRRLSAKDSEWQTAIKKLLEVSLTTFDVRGYELSARSARARLRARASVE